MDIIKDLVFLLIIILLLCRCLAYRREIVSQREYFINVLSHDFRVSVLAQLRGLNLIKKNNCFDTFSQELLSELINSTTFTLDMISMLLNTYQYKLKNCFFNYENLNLFDIITDTCSVYEKSANEKSIKLNNYCDKNLYFLADKTSMFKAFCILLNTVISNSEKNSDICIFSKVIQDKIQIDINYNGKFLTEEEHKRMFEKNSRFSTVGHGIKMNLVKKIIDFHFGKIFISNNHKNTFTIQLPIYQKNKSSETRLLWTFNE